MAIENNRMSGAGQALARVASRLSSIPGARRGKWLMLGIWLLIAAAAGSLAANLGDVEENDAAAYLPRTAESTEIAALLPEFYGDETIPAFVVYVRDNGLTDDDRAAAEAHRHALADLVPSEELSPPVPSEDGKALLLTVPLVWDADDEDAIFDQVDLIKAIVNEGLPAGLEAQVTGPAGYLDDLVSVFNDIDTTLLLATVSVVSVLLLLIYRSPVLWLLPIITVGIASQLANAVVYLLARYADLTVSSQSAGILTVLVFGVGTDYALLLLARYREELHHYEDRHAAMSVAMRRAGPAILASAATTTVGMLVLLTAELNSTRGLGPVAAAGVVSALLAMTTVLPALLVILGRWVFWPFIPRYGTPLRTETSPWARVAGMVGRRPRPLWVGTVVALAALTLGLTQLQTGLTMEEQFTTTPESVTGQQTLESHFPAGASSPAYVVANADAEDAVTAAIVAKEGVADLQPSLYTSHPTTNEPLVLIPAILANDPSSRAAEETIERLREAVHAVPSAAAIVGGDTAVTLDTRTSAARDERVVIPLVLVVVFIIVALLLRSVVAPAVLVATGVLSFLAAVGGSVLAFRWIFDFAGVDPTFRLLGFIFLVALSIDYNIFLMTRVREEVVHHGHRGGVLKALAVTGGVITSAGVVLAATFSMLAVFPLVFLVQLGVLVAFGVFLDAIVVRSLLVPALALEIGPKIWWPHRRTCSAEPAEPNVVRVGAD